MNYSRPGVLLASRDGRREGRGGEDGGCWVIAFGVEGEEQRLFLRGEELVT